jgi:hypothetical protein
MALQREEKFYDDLRNELATFMPSWNRLKALRDQFDDFGGDAFFDQFYAQDPAPEVPLVDLHAAVVSVNNLEVVMNGGPRHDFNRVKS